MSTWISYSHTYLAFFMWFGFLLIFLSCNVWCNLNRCELAKCITSHYSMFLFRKFGVLLMLLLYVDHQQSSWTALCLFPTWLLTFLMWLLLFWGHWLIDNTLVKNLAYVLAHRVLWCSGSHDLLICLLFLQVLSANLNASSFCFCIWAHVEVQKFLVLQLCPSVQQTFI